MVFLFLRTIHCSFKLRHYFLVFQTGPRLRVFFGLLFLRIHHCIVMVWKATYWDWSVGFLRIWFSLTWDKVTWGTALFNFHLKFPKEGSRQLMYFCWLGEVTSRVPIQNVTENEAFPFIWTQSLTQMPFSVSILSQPRSEHCAWMIRLQPFSSSVQTALRAFNQGPQRQAPAPARKSQIHSWALPCCPQRIVAGTRWAGTSLGDMKNKQANLAASTNLKICIELP